MHLIWCQTVALGQRVGNVIERTSVTLHEVK